MERRIARVRQVAGELGYETVVLWDIDSRDADRRADDRTVARAASQGGTGSIVLMHCGPPVTPRVLPVIIARYACAGYRFATVEQLLAGDRGVAARATCPPAPIADRSGALRSELAGREWRLAEADAGDGLGPVAPDTVLTLRFGPRRVSGVAGCVVFEVPVSVGTRGDLTLGRLQRDPIGCEDDANDPIPEAALRTFLHGDALRVVDGTLGLLDDGRELLRFRAATPLGIQGE